MTEFLSTREAAAVLGIKPDTLGAYSHRGQGPPFRIIAGRRVFTRADLDAWQAQRPGPGNWGVRSTTAPPKRG